MSSILFSVTNAVYRKFLRFFIAFISIIYIQSSAASGLLNLDEMAKEAKSNHLTFPKPEVDGRVQTLNKKGAMSPEIDRVTQQFLDNIKGKKALEIGISYGNVLLAALKEDVGTYVANDMDLRHLQIAALRIEEKMKLGEISQRKAKSVEFLPGSYPKEVNLPNNSFDCILVARVLHFLSPTALQESIEKFYQILKPGGKIYVVAITPYVKRYESFIPEYERRMKSGDLYPGYVKSLIPYLHANTSEKERKNVSTEPFMFLDSRVLTKAFSKEGFKIIYAKEFPLAYHSSIWSLDGRENVGLIAEKPVSSK